MRNIIKWMICISLVLCVCLGVTACGNADKQQVIKNDETDIGKENDSQSKGDEDTIGNGQMCSVIIKINPHFEIFLMTNI